MSIARAILFSNGEYPDMGPWMLTARAQDLNPAQNMVVAAIRRAMDDYADWRELLQRVDGKVPDVVVAHETKLSPQQARKRLKELLRAEQDVRPGGKE